jgi:hypothetical protein
LAVPVALAVAAVAEAVLLLTRPDMAVAAVAEVVEQVVTVALVVMEQAASSSLRSFCKDETLGFN